MAVRSDIELIAQELSALGQRLDDVEKRLSDVERVNARLEGAALITARAMTEISQHWDAVYEAMRRTEESSLGEQGAVPERSGPTERTS